MLIVNIEIVNEMSPSLFYNNNAGIFPIYGNGNVYLNNFVYIYSNGVRPSSQT